MASDRRGALFRSIICVLHSRGPLGGGGRFIEEIGGIEEKDNVDCVDMIFEDNEHHEPTLGVKLFWSKIALEDTNKLYERL